MRAGGDRETLIPTGPAVGAFPDVKFTINETQLRPGDLFFGYTDAVSATGVNFGKNRLEMLMDQHVSSARDFEEALKKHLFDHIGNAAQADDITYIAVKRLQDKNKN